jgi:hypothetical protein
MRSVLVVIGLLLAGCASGPSDRVEPAVESSASTAASRPVAAQVSPDHRPSDEPGFSESTGAFGVASPPEAVTGTPDPTPMSTTTTLPEIDVDLSGLDEVLEGLDVLLGDLDMAMSKAEGEFTP